MRTGRARNLDREAGRIWRNGDSKRQNLGRVAVLSPRTPAGRRVLVGQPLHECDGRVPGPSDLVTDGIEGPGQTLQLVELQLVIAKWRRGMVGRASHRRRFYGASRDAGGGHGST
jgi:hypothetical protein